MHWLTAGCVTAAIDGVLSGAGGGVYGLHSSDRIEEELKATAMLLR